MKPTHFRAGAPLFATLLALMLTAAPALAQQGPPDQPGRGYRGDAPTRGGFGLLLMDQDMDRDRLMTQLRDQDCEPRALYRYLDGGWSQFIPGAPDFVNRGFPSQLGANQIFTVDCQARNPAVLRLTDADGGGSYEVAAGERIRVALTSNPTTGYAWTVTPTPDAAVLTQLGDAFFVAESDLLGAGGVEVFDFVAQGAGTVTLSLEYARSFESQPAAQTWSVTITVTE